jgi:hypothetical protein
VEVTRSGFATLHQLSNDDGRFAFPELAAGRYRILIRKDGYLTGTYSPVPSPSPYSDGAALDFAPGERLDAVTLVLWPASSIRGIVSDADNEPIVRGAVQLFSREPRFDRVTWRHYANATPTDDQGFYEFNRVEPGDYVVVFPRQRQGAGLLVSARASGSLRPDALATVENALAAPATRTRYPTVFHPGAPTLAGASIVRVGAGEHLENVNIVAVPAASARVTVSGRLTGPPLPLPSVTIWLTPHEAMGELAAIEALSASAAVDGSFTFDEVPVGQYRLQAVLFPPPEEGTTLSSGTVPSGRSAGPPGPLSTRPTWLADAPILVAEAVAGLSVAMRPAGRIVGQIRIDSEATPFPLEKLPAVAVTFLPLDRDLGAFPYSGISRQGRFGSVGLPPGRYRMEIGTLQVAGLEKWWYPVSDVDGRRVSVIELGEADVRVTVTLTDRSTPLAGTVRNVRGELVPGASVIIFPRDPRAWSDELSVRLLADRHGRIETERLFPGDYAAAAVPSLPRFWKTPEYLSSIVGRAVPLHVELGEPRTLDLVVIE